MKTLLDKFYIKNWVIGICKHDEKITIHSKTIPVKFHWIRHPDFNTFYADPFIYHGKDGALYLFCEELSRNNFIGTITCLKLDSEFNIIQKNVLLKSNLHYSYPFLIEYNSKLFVIPENSSSNKLIAYEFDEVNLSLTNQIEILDTNLYDCTFLEHDSKFWLFGYKGNDKTNGELHVYYSSELFGVYVPHPSNPVKYGLDACRPAGSFIKIKDNIYRPSQNNAKRYGNSISMNKISLLNELEFKEEFCFELNSSKFLDGYERLHTINFSGEYMVVDATYTMFSPTTQFKRLLRSIKSKLVYFI